MFRENNRVINMYVVKICMYAMVFLTNIAMLENIFSPALSRLPIIGVALLLGGLVLTGVIRYSGRNGMLFLGIAILFIISTVILEFTGNEYRDANLTYPIELCTVLFFLGFSSGSIIRADDYKDILMIYVISTLIVSVIVYLKYYVGFNWGLRYSEYKYRGQLSQAIVFSVFILITCIKNTSKVWTIIKCFIFAFFTILLLMMKCRSAIVEVVFGVLIFMMLRGTSKRIKYIIIGIGAAFIIALLVNEKFFDLIINQVVFYGRDSSDLNDVSSGRLTILSGFPELWSGHELFGIGNYYFECFPLNAILQYGVFVGGVAIIIAFYPCFWSWRQRNVCYDYGLNAFLLISSVTCFVCGLFEAIAPVGPGIKFFILWLSFGNIMGNETQQKCLESL